MEHAFVDITNMEMSDDDLLASELSVGDGLPEFDPADILGLHSDDDAAFKEEMWSVEGHDDEVENADTDDALHLHINEAVEVILHLNSSKVTSPLQEQLHNRTPATTKADDCKTLETAPRDNAQTTPRRLVKSTFKRVTSNMTAMTLDVGAQKSTHLTTPSGACLTSLTGKLASARGAVRIKARHFTECYCIALSNVPHVWLHSA